MIGRARNEGPEPVHAEAPLLVIAGYRAPNPASQGGAGGGLPHSARPLWAATSSGLQGWPAQAGGLRAAGSNGTAPGSGPGMWGPAAGRTSGLFRDMPPTAAPSGFPGNTLALAAAAMVAASSQAGGRGPSGQHHPLRRSSSGFSSYTGAAASPWASSTASSVASTHSNTSISGGGASGGGALMTYTSSVGQSTAGMAAPLTCGSGGSFNTASAAGTQQPSSRQQHMRPLSGGQNVVGPHGHVIHGSGIPVSTRGGPAAQGANPASAPAATTVVPVSHNAAGVESGSWVTAVAATSMSALEVGASDADTCTTVSQPGVEVAAACLARDGAVGHEVTGLPSAATEGCGIVDDLPARGGDLQPGQLAFWTASSGVATDPQAAALPVAGEGGHNATEDVHSDAAHSLQLDPSAGDAAAPTAAAAQVALVGGHAAAELADRNSGARGGGGMVPPLDLPVAAHAEELGAGDMPRTSTPRKRRSSKRRSSTASASGNRGNSTPRRFMSGTSSTSRNGRPATVVGSPGLASYPASPRAAVTGGGGTSRSRSGNALIPSGTAAGPLPGPLARSSSGCGSTPLRCSPSLPEDDGWAAGSGALTGHGTSEVSRSGQVDVHGLSHASRPPLPKPSSRDVPAVVAESATAALHEAAGAAAQCRHSSSVGNNDSIKAVVDASAMWGEDAQPYQLGGAVPVGTDPAAALSSKPTTPLLPSLHVRTSGRLLDLPSAPQYMLGPSAASRASGSHLGGAPLHPDSPSCAAHARLAVLQSSSPCGACNSTPYSPAATAAAAAGGVTHSHPRRPSLEPLSPSAARAGVSHALCPTGTQWGNAEVEGAASACGAQAAELVAPFSPPLGPRPPSHLSPLGHPPPLLHQGPAAHHSAPPAAVGPASRVVSQLKSGAEYAAQLNLRETAPAGFTAAKFGNGASAGSAVGATAVVDGGDRLFLVSGNAANKPKGVAAGTPASRRSSRQASPARTSLFHTQQLTDSRVAAVSAASADPEEQVRKAQERLEAYARAQKDKAKAAEAEEVARRQRHVGPGVVLGACAFVATARARCCKFQTVCQPRTSTANAGRRTQSASGSQGTAACGGLRAERPAGAVGVSPHEAAGGGHGGTGAGPTGVRRLRWHIAWQGCRRRSRGQR